MSQERSYHVVGLCGSLRKASYNKGLLESINELPLNNIHFTMADISTLPFYNQDLEAPFPIPVIELANLLNQADIVMMSTPEYNFSFSGVLKNALEWLSRSGVGTPLKNKPVGIMGATPVDMGTANAQSQLRQVLYNLEMKLVTRPIIMIGGAKEKFDDAGRLTDQDTQLLVQQMIEEAILMIKKE